ncbi:MAG: ABC transporter ATP-binding protein [Acidimicrobiales bacterium]
MADVAVEALTKEFAGGVKALDHLDLAVEEGEFFALLGPSGCGKTTLLRSIAGLERPTSGKVLIGGRDVTRTPPGGRGIAMVFQDYALLPHMTVADNIAYPLKIRHVPKAQRLEAASRTAASLGLDQYLKRRPAELSGGQQQRVALARAITSRAKVFLLDEPLSNLDAQLRMEARIFLKRLQQELAVTTIYVTHDQSEALALADRMAVMERGVIRQVGPPVEVYLRPDNLFVAGFMGATPINLLEAKVDTGVLRVGDNRIGIPSGTQAGLSSGRQVTVAVRPEHVSLSDAAQTGGFEGSVVLVEHLGDDDLVTLEGGGVTIRAKVNIDDAVQVGDLRWAVPNPERVLVFDPSTGERIRDQNAAAPARVAPHALTKDAGTGAIGTVAGGAGG